MMQRHSRLAVLILSGSLVVSGILLIFLNMGLLDFAKPRLEYLLSALLLAGGVGFAWFFLINRTNWWQLIPSFTCLSLATMLYMTTVSGFEPRLIAAVLLWGMALSFLLAYVIDPQERWWGLVMGGLMAVLGVNTAVSGVLPSIEVLGAILFGGLGVVFVVLFLLGDKSRFWWAPIPGFIMMVYSAFAYMDTRPERWLEEWQQWWPAVLILAGIFVVVSAYLFPRMYRFSPARANGAASGPEEVPVSIRSTSDVLREREGRVPGSAIVVLHELQN